jgi:hypothetical protein
MAVCNQFQLKPVNPATPTTKEIRGKIRNEPGKTSPTRNILERIFDILSSQTLTIYLRIHEQ